MTKTIEHIKDRIQFYKTSKANYEKECIKHPNNKTFEEAEKLCEELIQINEQIKCELEAWEVVKKHCDYQDGDPFDCIPEGFYIIEPIRGKDFLIVRKALGVKEYD